jgi:hypothetical protein
MNDDHKIVSRRMSLEFTNRQSFETTGQVETTKRIKLVQLSRAIFLLSFTHKNGC